MALATVKRRTAEDSRNFAGFRDEGRGLRGSRAAGRGASSGAGGFRIWSTIRVSYRPSTKAGKPSTRRWKGMLVLIPSMTYSSSARAARRRAISRVAPVTISLATSES